MQENVYKDPFAAECNQYARKFDDAFNAKDWVTTEHLIAESETILDKGIMPSEKVLDFPVDCNTLTGSVNL